MTETQQRCVAFGRALIATADLDPLYVMLYTAWLNREVLGRFILGYSMFYHAGVASYLASVQGDFWEECRVADREKWPRGTERRHFRGDISRNSIEACAAVGSPEDVLDIIYPMTEEQSCLGAPLSFGQVFKGAQALSGFGPWIAFKLADIADRTRYLEVDFSDCALSIYRDPVKGAALWRYGDQDAVIQPGEIGEVCEEIRLALGPELLAPPLYDRPINIQEVETVLCKFKSHTNGHYDIGKDTREITHGLADWGPLAERLAACPFL